MGSGSDRLHRRLLRDRGDISGADGLALEDDRRRRRQGRAHRGDGSQRLWALAQIASTAAYCEIEATYLVQTGLPLKTIADVDAKGVRIAVTGRSAYGLWLRSPPPPPIARSRRHIWCRRACP